MEDSGRLLRLVGIALVIAVVLVGAWLFLMARKTPAPVLPKIQEVTLTQGERSITVKRSGTIIVRIPEGVFQQQWDEERVAAFFAQFESDDLAAFSAVHPSVEGYLLTVRMTDGSEVTYIVPFALDVPLPGSVAQLIETFEELSAAYQIPSAPSPTPTPPFSFPSPTLPQIQPTPTAFPTFTPPVPTPTPQPQQSGGWWRWRDAPYAQTFVCEFLDPDIWPNVLSEVLCTPE